MGILSNLINKFRIRGQEEPKYQLTENTAAKRKKESKLYPVISKLPILSGYIENLRLQLYSVYSVDELDIRRRIMSLLKNGLISGLLTFGIITWMMDRTLYNLLMAAVIAIVMASSIVKGSIGNQDKLLEELPDALEDLKQHFHTSKILPAAYDKTVKESSPQIAMHFKMIQDIVDAPAKDGKVLLKKYFNQCQNRFLKILAAYSYLTNEHGDVIVGSNGKSMKTKSAALSEAAAKEEGESLFSRNMNYLKSEIRIEFRKRRKIRMQLAGLKFFTIMPVFMIPLAKKFVMTNFGEFLVDVQNFYLSSYSYIDAVFCAAVSILCYIGYNETQRFDWDEARNNIAKRSWEEQLLKLKPLERIVRQLVPDIETRKHRQLSEAMVMSGRYQKLEWFYLKKVLTAAAAFVIIVAMLMTTQLINQNRIYTDIFYGVQDKILYKNLVENTGIPKEKLLEADRKVIDAIMLSKSKKEVTAEEAQGIYIQSTGQAVNENIMQMTVERLNAKLNYYRQEKSVVANVGKLLLIIAVTLLSYWIPDIKLQLAVSNNKASMVDEVMRMQTVVVLLMRHTHVTPETILDWLITFSDIFFRPLTEVKNNYNKLGGTKAIKELIKEVNYKPFKRLLQNLALAEEKLPLEEAFAGLEQDRMYNEEIRKDNTEIVVEDRVAVGKTLTKLSIGTTTLLYLVAPVAYGIIIMLIQTFSKIQNIM